MNILVPVDFTDNAFNAYQYANKLAYQFDADLTLLHVFEGTFDVISAKEVNRGRGKYTELQNRLKSFSHLHPNQNSNVLAPVKTHCEVVQGDILNEIAGFAKELEVDMIVAGTRDKHDLSDKWLGTVSQGIAQEAQCPVLLVPNGSTFRGYERMVVATDYHASNFMVLDRILTFNKPFGASLHFLHVGSAEDQRFEGLKDEIFDYMMSYGEPSHVFELEKQVGTDVVKGLFEYTKKKSADLLVMISSRRDFLRRMINTSLTRRVVLQSPLPVLVVHANNK